MKRLLFLFPLIFSTGSMADFLSQYQWENRIILIKSDDPTPMMELLGASRELDERDIIWFQLRNDTLYHNSPVHVPNESKMALDYYFGDDTIAVLIGKDGMIKSRDGDWDLSRYINQIDTMLMRQQENNN